jgi:hypothetical protein
MTTIVRKAYWNFAKEEAWLNQMAAKGLALTAYSWCSYAFEPCEPGEYLYRIEYLENAPTGPEGAAYLSFMEDSGVETVATHRRWAYFRRPASNGPFDIYSDLDARLKHFTRIRTLWAGAAIVEWLIALGQIVSIVNLTTAPESGTAYDSVTVMVIVALILVAAVAVLFTTLAVRLQRSIGTLTKERQLRE